MPTVEQLCQTLLERQGFIVLNSPKELEIGKACIEKRIGMVNVDLVCSFVVVGLSSIEEFREQHRLAGEPPPGGMWPYFYRVTAE